MHVYIRIYTVPNEKMYTLTVKHSRWNLRLPIRMAFSDTDGLTCLFDFTIFGFNERLFFNNDSWVFIFLI